MAIVINGSGTVTGLAVGGLPDGTVDADTLAANSVVTGKITDGAILNADINASAAIAGTKINGSFGKVLQVVHASSSTEVGMTGTSYADIGLTASITPSSSSNKVLIQASIPVRKRVIVSGSSTDNSAHLKLVRGSTDLTEFGRFVAWNDSSSWNQETVTFSWLDSPSTTSATAYKIQMKGVVASNYVYSNHDNSVSTITLMEIAG